MSVYDENKARFPELDQIGDWLENNNHNFLRSIYDNSKKWKLSDRQIESASRSWGYITDGTPKPNRITVPSNEAKIYRYVADNYLAHTYYNERQSDFLYKMIDLAEVKGEMSEKQYESMFNIFYKFKKSILKKMFGNYKK